MTMDDTEDGVSSMETLVQELASSRLDAASPSKRLDTIKEAAERITEEEIDRSSLASLGDSVSCRSDHAVCRMSNLYLTAITNENGEENLSCLVKGLCHVLAQAKDPSVVTQLSLVLEADSKTLRSKKQVLVPMFRETAKESTCDFAPALTLGSALDDSQNAADWLELLLQCSFSTFASRAQVGLCQPLLNRVSQEDWANRAVSTIVLKLRANPERSLETTLAIIEGLNGIDLSDRVDQLSETLLKQLKSSKAHIRSIAQLILVRMALMKLESSTFVKLALALANALSTSLTQADYRQAAYEVLRNIASERQLTVEATVVSTVLTSLCTALGKEAKTATSARDAGFEALLQWMVVAKRNNGGDKGYDQACDFLQTPLVSGSGPDTVWRWGRLLTYIHPDVVESIVLDIWSPKVEKGLQLLIDAAIKKHNASSTIPPVEGLIAVNLALIHAFASGSLELSAGIAKVLSAGSAYESKSSFVYARSMTDALATNPIVGQLLPRTIALYSKLLAKKEGMVSAPLICILKNQQVSSAANALACCVTHPSATPNMTASKSILSCVQTVLTYQPSAADALLEALLIHVNALTKQSEEMAKATNATREAREVFEPGKQESRLNVKGQGSPSASHYGFDTHTVRVVASKLAMSATNPTSLGTALLLLHAGSSCQAGGRTRRAFTSRTLKLINDKIIVWLEKDGGGPGVLGELADFIAKYACNYRPQEKTDQTSTTEAEDTPERSIEEESVFIVGVGLHKAALSLVSTIGRIGSSFDAEIDDPEDDEMKPYVFAHRLCTKALSSRFSSATKTSLQKVEAFTESDIDLYKSQMGLPFHGDNDIEANGDRKKTATTSKRKTGVSLEDEEWERQMRKELAQKSSSGDMAKGGTPALSPEEKDMADRQDNDRRRISFVLEGDFSRALQAIQSLCLSDIEVGNSCLPAVSDVVVETVVSRCAAMQGVPKLAALSQATLAVLASCVYEFDEMYAPSMARALAVCCRRVEDGDGAEVASEGRAFIVSALPSLCEDAARTITEMDELHDHLSGASFSFLFPVIRAALTGPRTTPGCDGALRVLDRHTPLLAGDEANPIVVSLRKEMVIAVLELLAYDRSQTFVDPSPYDSIVSCYYSDDAEANGSPALTTSELAPLLDERGALGAKNCRVASMIALGAIAGQHQKLCKNNPLIENRIWLNCFDEEERIRGAARAAWRVVNGDDSDDSDSTIISPPSLMYAIPLLPLLHHSNGSVAKAAAQAYAHAAGMNPMSTERSMQKLCSNFIENYPTPADDAKQSPAMPSALEPKKVYAPPPTKKPIPTGLTKKKTVKKTTALSITGIGKPKTAKKKITNSALLKPKEERTFDRELLESQFLTEKQVKEAEKDSSTKIEIRNGVIRAVSACTDSSTGVKFDLSTLKLVTSFLVAYGLADGNDEVRGEARNALRDIVASFGNSEDAIAFLLPLFENVLSTGEADVSSLASWSPEKVPRGKIASERRKEGVVVALGSVALHLKGAENESKIDSTIDMLISALKTPSEDIQSSVALCLAKLMKKGRTQERVEDVLTMLMSECLKGDSRSVRRGAAFGISAVIKGSGIATLKKFEVMKKLEEACASGPSNAKEGALFAIELLSTRLGLLFEPYVIALLPSLLRAFSDSSDFVRLAASNTADVIMSNLSAHGVKLLMPAVLTAFDDPSWRTKQASIHMLGSMSHLAPKQLASALPKVVPQLIEACSDTHPKVKASAEEALNEISKVIKNPEVSSISSILLKALTDAAETIRGLEALIETEFVHAIDAPSLAIIVPVLHRGLRDRGATTKRYGALIAGNICTMIHDPRDFDPYVPVLIPDLKSALLDPIPDVRSTSAKALGSLTRGLGEEALADLRPWLIETLRDESRSSAERSGAAQGLTEVLIACGADVAESVMIDEILPLKSHPQASTREGVLWVLTFLPPALGQSYTPLIDASLPALLGGLSDDSEPVRDVAMRAGRVLVRSHGKVHIDKILPSLEAGLTDEDYRIRVASLTLLGDLLSMIGGTTVVKGEGETQDDIRRAERAQAQIALVLGADTRKRVLSGLYMARSDTAAVVRQSAVQVWKTVVSVTARTLRDILQVLVGQIVDALASGHPERTQVAGRCLGDVVHKLGDSVLPEIIPVLRKALYTGDEYTRRGVCVGLCEVLDVSTKEQILRFLEIIVKVVQDALCDEEEGVREMAASCFQSLHKAVGNKAMDEIVPSLLVSLESDDEEARAGALNGLTGILSIRSRELLPYIVPRLVKSPISKTHADALGSIAAVTGATIHMHFSSIVPNIIIELGFFYTRELDDEEKSRLEAIRSCARSMCRNVDEGGVNWLVSEIASKCGSDKEEIRVESCWMLQIFIEERKDKLDFNDQILIILRELLYRFNDDSPGVLKAAHGVFSALSTNVPAEELVKHIEFIRNLIASMVSDARRRKGGVGDGEFLLPGFNMPKGLEPLLPIYQRGILYGTPTIREVAASGLGELIGLTSSTYLAGPLIIKMTGPLLRIVGDRNPPDVKVAILRTLGMVLVKGGPALRAFVPQFQTTFVKALSDPSRQVRVEAIDALALLMPLSTRVDPLLKELVAGSLGKGGAASEAAAVAAVQTATLEALATVLKKGGKKANLPDSVPSALDAGKELLNHEDEGVREAAAKVVGAACALLDIESTLDVIHDVLSMDESSADNRHGKACACYRILASSVGPMVSKQDKGLHDDITNLMVTYMGDDKGVVKESGCVGIGAAIGSASNPTTSLRGVERTILDILQNKQERMEVQRAMARGLCVALLVSNEEDRVAFFGKTLIDATLRLAMSGSQRVQFAFNDVLWLVLDVPGGDAGLEAYLGIANFDNAKAIKSIHTKVLTRIKEVDIDK